MKARCVGRGGQARVMIVTRSVQEVAEDEWVFAIFAPRRESRVG